MGLQGSTAHKQSVSGQVFRGEWGKRQYGPENLDRKRSGDTDNRIVRGIGAQGSRKRGREMAKGDDAVYRVRRRHGDGKCSGAKRD